MTCYLPIAAPTTAKTMNTTTRPTTILIHRGRLDLYFTAAILPGLGGPVQPTLAATQPVRRLVATDTGSSTTIDSWRTRVAFAVFHPFVWPTHRLVVTSASRWSRRSL